MRYSKWGAILFMLLAAGPGLRAEDPPQDPLFEESAPRRPKPKPEPVSPQWRGRERPSEAAKKRIPKAPALSAPEDKRERFAPRRAEDVPAPAADVALPAGEDEQWRRSPADRRWESWREFPPRKQADLWRGLPEPERAAYWNAMNVHERATLWLKFTPVEKDVYWEKLAEPDRESLCDALPPNEAGLWRGRLSKPVVREAEDDGRGKFRPAKPAPGYAPKSMYREDDEQ